MTCKNGVYSPEPDFLVRKLRKLPTLHDAEYVKKFMTEVTTGLAKNTIL